MPCCYCSTTEGEPELTSTREPSSLHPSWGLPILHLYTGAMMKDLTVEQCCTVYPEGNKSVLTQPRREVSSEIHAITQGEEQNMPQNAHYHSCLVSTYTILFT